MVFTRSSRAFFRNIRPRILNGRLTAALGGGLGIDGFPNPNFRNSVTGVLGIVTDGFAADASRRVMHRPHAVHRRRNALHARLELQRQELRIVA